MIGDGLGRWQMADGRWQMAMAMAMAMADGYGYDFWAAPLNSSTIMFFLTQNPQNPRSSRPTGVIHRAHMLCHPDWIKRKLKGEN